MNLLVETLQARIAELERDNARYENGRVILCNLIDELTARVIEGPWQGEDRYKKALEGIASCCTACECCEIHRNIARRAIE